MVIDTSVLIAIVFDEPEADRFIQAMNESTHVLLSAVNLVEATAVLLRQGEDDIEQDLDGLIERAGVVVVPVDEIQARFAREAYRRYGRTRHPAALNLGDCFSYALAVASKEPLLFKGNDFSQTDVLIA